MSWSHLGNAQKHQHYASKKTYHKPVRHSRYTPRCVQVSTTTKVITCALVILILATPVIAVNQHVVTCTKLPSSCVSVKNNIAPMPNLRQAIIDFSWPSTFHVQDLFMNILPEIPLPFRMRGGMGDFFDTFTQRYNMSRTDSYPNLPKIQIGRLDTPLNEKQKISLGRGLFNLYDEAETGVHGCLLRFKINVLGTCWNKIGNKSYLVVDFIRSTILDLRNKRVKFEDFRGVYVERSTHDACQQQAIISFEEDDVFIEVVSHIQDEFFEPPLELLHLEEPEPECP